jgi:hypothetical protein
MRGDNPPQDFSPGKPGESPFGAPAGVEDLEAHKARVRAEQEAFIAQEDFYEREALKRRVALREIRRAQGETIAPYEEDEQITEAELADAIANIRKPLPG